MNETVKKDITEKKTENEPVKKQVKPREPRIGVVIDCVKLNVRKSPSTDAEVLAEIAVNSEVQILGKGSDKDFFHVCTAAGVDGFCMKKFIKVK